MTSRVSGCRRVYVCWPGTRNATSGVWPRRDAVHHYVRPGWHAIQMNGNATCWDFDKGGSGRGGQGPGGRGITTRQDPAGCSDADDANHGRQKRAETPYARGSPPVAVWPTTCRPRFETTWTSQRTSEGQHTLGLRTEMAPPCPRAVSKAFPRGVTKAFPCRVLSAAPSLLVGAAGDRWLAAAADVGLPAARVSAAWLSDCEALLVRPDGIVEMRVTAPVPVQFLADVWTRCWPGRSRCRAPDRLALARNAPLRVPYRADLLRLVAGAAWLPRLKSAMFPKALGILLVVGGACYLVGLLAVFLIPEWRDDQWVRYHPVGYRGNLDGPLSADKGRQVFAQRAGHRTGSSADGFRASQCITLYAAVRRRPIRAHRGGPVGLPRCRRPARLADSVAQGEVQWTRRLTRKKPRMAYP